MEDNPTRKREPGDGGLWATIEKISKTLSAVAIPVVLAGGGWFIQKQLQNQAVSRDYVQLAVSILREPDQSKVKPEMRQWAVDLLQANSPIKLSGETEAKLKKGELTLPLPETFTAIATSALTPELKAASDTTLTDFEGYLIKAGFQVKKGEVQYAFVDGSSIKRGGREYISLYDPKKNSLEIAAAYKDEKNFLLHEYMRHVLTPPTKRVPDTSTLSPSWAYYAIESGLADYYSCSFAAQPRWESKSGLSVDLTSNHAFSEISLREVLDNDKAGVVWGAAFWKLRQQLGKEVADPLLAATWKSWYPSDTTTDASAEFVQKLIELHKAAGGKSENEILEIFRSRGLKV